MRSTSTAVLSLVALMAACSNTAPSTSEASETSGGEQAVAEPATVEAASTDADSTPTEASADTSAEPHHHHAAACGEVTVTFASGSSALDADGEARLSTYEACLASERARVVYVSGTTDPSGSDEDNMALARARGRAVADYLHTLGLHTDFEIHALGEAGALPSRQVWPLERAATVSDVRTR